MIVSAASSSACEPVLSANTREINLPDRSMVNATLALPVCPSPLAGKYLLLAICVAMLARQALALSEVASVCACAGKVASNPRSATSRGNFICINADINRGAVDFKAYCSHCVCIVVGNSNKRAVSACLTATSLPR